MSAGLIAGRPLDKITVDPKGNHQRTRVPVELEDRLFDQPSYLVVGADRGPHQGFEIEQEGLLEDADGRDLLGEPISGDEAHVDGAGRHRAHRPVVLVQAAVVEDLDDEGLLAAPFHLFLELRQVDAGIVRAGQLRCEPKLDLLRFRRERRQQQTCQQQT